MKSTKVNKRREFSNKKTRRIKRRGGMHKRTPKQLALDHAKDREQKRKNELAAASAVLGKMVSSGVSPGLRNTLLTGTGNLAGRVSDLLLHREDPWLLRMNGEPLLDATRPHTSLPALIEADDMFQQAEKLCSDLRRLPDAEMWTRSDWGAMSCSPLATRMCADAVQLYEGAIKRKYLPAYAPLAWMMSHADRNQSLSLCDECIAVCDARIATLSARAPFAKEAKTDCTALRALIQYEHDIFLLDELEMETPFPGGRMDEVPAMKAPSIEELHEIAKESMAEGSKYGHALKWLLLMTDRDAKQIDVDKTKKEAEDMGMDLERCRYCFSP